MAKSVGNIFLLHAALDEYGPEALKMYFAAGHWRQPLAFSPDALDDARGAVNTLREHLRLLDPAGTEPEGQAEYLERFLAALADDFNTAAARGVLFEWVREANRRIDAGQALGPGRLPEMLHLLGLESLLDSADEEPDEEAQRLLREREEARAAGDFEQADRRRGELAELGWEVRDTPEGPRLVRRRPG